MDKPILFLALLLLLHGNEKKSDLISITND